MLVNLVPMTEDVFLSYLEHAIPAYARDNVDAGRWPAAVAHERSRKAYEETLPQGLQTPDHYLFQIFSQENECSVGVLWFAVVESRGVKSAFVYDIEIQPEHRRKGFAEAAFEGLQSMAKDLELSHIDLQVFAHNREAIALYEKLQFRTTGLNMMKSIDSPQT